MYVEAERGQNKPVQKGFQRPLVAPSQKVASVISNSQMGKPLFSRATILAVPELHTYERMYVRMTTEN